MHRSAVHCLLPAALLALLANTAARSRPAIEIEDAIAMTRIQQTPRRDEDIVFSPNGHRFVCVVWKGDLDRNVNVYSLLLFDVRQPAAAPKQLLSATGRSDPYDQHATPISGMRFLSDTRLALLASLNGEPTQIYTVDVESREVSRLVSHPAAIRSFSASADGRVVAFSALASPDERLLQEMRQTGFSVFDQQLPTPLSFEGAFVTPETTPQYYWSAQQANAFAKTAYGPWVTHVREYFVSPSGSTSSRRLESLSGQMATTIEDTVLRTRPDLTMSPAGSHAVVVPFARASKDQWARYRYFREYRNPYVQAMVTSFGLVDLRTGHIEPLLTTPIEFYSTPRPMWAPDGQSVIVNSVPPAGDERTYEAAPQLLEVDVATRQTRPIPASGGWQPVRWIANPESVVLQRGSSFGLSTRRSGEWQAVSPLATREDTGFNARYGAATNGTVVVGVKDSLTTAPELALYDLASKRTTVLTNLNPDLRQRAYAAVEKVFWPGPAGDTAFGYLIRPVGAIEGTKYPAVILLKDTATPDSSDDSFMIDGQQQLSGWAIQTFAARGLLVLLTPPPPSHSETAMTAREGERIMAHVHHAIDYLDGRGLIDRRKIGISGWSRAAYWTDYIITHSTAFAAATDIDGGGNYKDFHQRWGASDAERDQAGRFQLDVRRVSTPLLSEQYGALSLLGQGEFISALRALGKPVDLYYYPDTPHSLKSPLHRLHSLRRHVDWFRFWLQDYEDPSPEKRTQYARWRQLRALQGGPTVERK